VQPLPPARAGSSDSTQYRIGPEDLLHISVWGNEELTNDVVVRPDGKISIPLLQDVQAEGLTARELAGVIHQKLLAYIKDPNVSVIVKEINATKISVIGYVVRPGTFPLRGDLSVLQALSQAGGFTPFASPRKIKLIRKKDGKTEVRVINYYRMINKGGEGDYLLKPGDTIVVP
jgi:polysaccharide export outer membrane protein